MKRYLTVLLSMFISLIFVIAADATTFVYQLEKDGRQVGSWAAEIKNTDSLMVLESMGDFSGQTGAAMLIRNFSGYKQVALDRSSHQKMKSMTFAPLKWNIQTRRSEIVVKRYEHGKLVDELTMYPILPVYDFISYIFSLKKAGNKFDFYLLEPKHEKLMTSEKLGDSMWLLKFEETPLIKVKLNSDGIPQTIDFGVCPVCELEGYKLKLRCTRQDSLSKEILLRPENVLERFVSVNPWAHVGDTGCRGEFHKDGYGYRLVFGDSHCIRLNRDVTGVAKAVIVDQMRQKGALLDGFKSENLDIRYDKYRGTLYPWLSEGSAGCTMTVKLPPFYNEIAAKRLDSLTFRKPRLRDNKIIIPYTYRKCIATEEVEAIDLEDLFKKEHPDLPRADMYMAESSNDQLIIKAIRLKKKWYGATKKVEIGSITMSASQFRDKYLMRNTSRSGKLDRVLFDTGSVESLGELRVIFRLCDYREAYGEKVIDTAGEMGSKLGISPEYLTLSKVSEKQDSITIKYSIGRYFDLPVDSIITRIIQKELPMLINPKLRITVSRGGIWLTGSSGVSLTQDQIFDLFGISKKAVVEKHGTNLKCVYFDFTCK